MSKTVQYEMRYDSHGSLGPGVYCTCGKHKIHNRGRVLARWVHRHRERTGHKWRHTS